jgi:putative zinc finger protein
MDAFTERLSDYLDEELQDRERENVEAHVRTCAECRETLDALREVAARARALTPRPPSTDLWAAIASRLDAPPAGRVVPLDGFRGRRGPSAPRRISFTLPQLAAAAVLLIVASAGVTWMIRPRTAGSPATMASTTTVTSPVADGTPVIRVANFADAQYDAAVSDLQRALDEGRGRLDPKTVQVLEKNLAIIDAAIDQARKALVADPANTYLNSYLADARRRKLDLLRDAASALANLPS